MKFVIYFEDTSPDTGDISQVVTVAYAKTMYIASLIVTILQIADNNDPNRIYKSKTFE